LMSLYDLRRCRKSPFWCPQVSAELTYLLISLEANINRSVAYLHHAGEEE
jgi:hypothetical protein